MFHVKVKLDKSNIHGIGLFADQDISKGTVIHTISPALEVYFSKEEYLALSPDEQATVNHYGYFDKHENHWHLSGDDIRFCNHQKNATTTMVGDDAVATRDIKKGEELTEDYTDFEELREEIQ